MSPGPGRGERGTVLLTVLWITAVLSLVAFSVATTVRAETERAGTHRESTRAYYLARAGVERMLLWLQWAPAIPGPGGRPYLLPWQRRVLMPFPEGEVDVEIIPESAKFNLNLATAPELVRLLAALGQNPAQAQQTALAIVDWRTPAAPGAGRFDALYLGANPSFSARHASFESTEELLMVHGVTPELYHGNYVRDAQGRLRPTGGLRDCVSVWSPHELFDAGTVEPAVATAVGNSPAAVSVLVQARQTGPLSPERWAQVTTAMGGPQRLGIVTGSIVTLRATSRMRLANGQWSDLRRTVEGTYQLSAFGTDPPNKQLSWHDFAWVNGQTSPAGPAAGGLQ